MAEKRIDSLVDVVSSLNPKWLIDIEVFKDNFITLDALGEPFNKLIENIRDESSQITAAFAPMLECINPVSKKLSEDLKVFENISDVSSRITAAFTPILESINPFPDFGDYFQRLWDKFHVTEVEATIILRKYKWLIGGSFSVGFVYEVVKVSKENGNQRVAINKLFIDYLTGNNFLNLIDIVDNWKTKPLHKPRMKIFKDCVYALKSAKGKYNPSNLVTPTLVAQIDGILNKFMVLKDIKKSDPNW